MSPTPIRQAALPSPVSVQRHELRGPANGVRGDARLGPFAKGLTGKRVSMLALLRELPLLSQLPADLLQCLASNAQIRLFAREALIVQQDQTDDDLFVLLSGRVHVERDGHNQRQVLLSVVATGGRVGEMCLIDGEPHNASARCVQACQVVVLKGADVRHCLEQSPGFARAWAMVMVGQLRQANQRILSLSLDDVRERVMRRLSQCSELGPQGQRVVGNEIGRSELARMVGASREMVCRVLRRLHDSGHIELQRDRSILLRNPPAD